MLKEVISGIIFLAGVLSLGLISDGEDIINTARVDYQDAQGVDYSANSPEVRVTLIGTVPADDDVAPDAITDLGLSSSHKNSLSLTWTSPIDRDNAGQIGPVQSYDLRYMDAELIWSDALLASNEPAPKTPGQAEVFDLTGLTPDTVYWIGIKSSDGNNVSAISNILKVKTLADIINPVTKIKVKIDPEGTYLKEFTEVKIKFIDPLSGAVVAQTTASSNAAGEIEFSIEELSSGTYHLVIIVPNCLTQKIANISVVDDIEVEFKDLLIGDFNRDDRINVGDWALMSASWGTGDRQIDLNQDGLINTLDWSYINKNWHDRGDD